MDVLKVLPLEDWGKLKESLKRDWPKYMIHYRWVDNALRWKRKNPQVKIEIYCPNGKLEHGVFFGLASYGMRFVIVFAFDEAIDLLKHVISTTKLIDWNRIIIMGVGFEVLLEEFFKSINIKAKEIYVANCRFKSKEECSQVEIDIPEGYELRELNNSHTRLIHSLWPHNNFEGSYEFVEMVLRLSGGIGLFSKTDERLVSWITQTDFGGLGLLQTVEEYKRKGFARLMVQVIAKKIADEQDLDSLLFVVKGNESSRKLFDKLDYESKGTISWYIL